ncbi:Vitamin B12 transporter BtuB [Alphaproteobacteria bacterium SO-S41]|nr:Vitamin B12 transporter BtuB [Alphaproteobacteria bacterium SO-S41]
MLNLARERLLASTIISGFAASFALAGVAAAQEPAPAAPAASAEEEVVVTGSRIKQPGLTSISPVTTVSSEEIRLQQKTDVEQIIRELPASLPGDNASVNNGTAGVTSVNLRGLGAQRNLVLLDGKRMVPYSVDGIVDLSNIPLALIERIDVVTGGASAVYGSDAISGAVNFILKKDFEGVAIDSTYSITDSGDGNTASVSATVGAGFDDGKGNVTLSANFTNRQGVQLGQRDIGRLAVSSATGVAGGGSGTSIPSRFLFQIPGGFGITAGSKSLTSDGPAGTFGAQGGPFNFNPFNYFQTPQDRYSFLASGYYEIAPSVEFYLKAVFANTKVRQQVAPSGLFANSFDINLTNPYLPVAARNQIITAYNAYRTANPTVTLADIGVTDNNNNNTVDSADYVNLTVSRRTTELGARSTTFDNNAYQITAGFRGTFADSWDWDVSYQHGKTSRTQLNAGYVNLDAAQEALLASSTTTCLSGNASCVPLNVFGLAEGSISPTQAAFISGFALLNQDYTQDIVSGSITGELGGVQSPWASDPLAIALGMEYRQEKGTSNPDQCLLTACLGGLGGASPPVAGGYDVYEVFGEAIVPIIQDLDGAHLLQLELGFRVADYSATGQNTTWKVGLEYAPIEELRFRGMIQRAVRAPNVTEIATPVTSGLDDAAEDPCSGTLTAGKPALQALCVYTGVNPAFFGSIPDINAGQVNAFFGSDPLALPAPETADTQSFGVVWTPDFGDDSAIRNFAISLDYYKISIDDFIGNVTAQEILDGCYVGGDLSLCDRIRRTNSNLIADGSGIEEFTTNLVNLKAEGMELAVNFAVDLSDELGKLDVSFNGNYYIKNEFQSLATLPVTECVGLYGKSCGNPTSEFRFQQRTTWTMGDWQVSYLWRYLSPVDIEANQRTNGTVIPAFQTIEGYHYFDLGVSYQVLEEVGITLNISNIFDKEAPLLGDNVSTTSAGSGNTLPSVYDTLGRTYALGVNVRF